MGYAFISGATGGIGKAFAFALAKSGCNLFITGRSQGKISALKSEITSKYPVAVEGTPCDLASERSRKKLLSVIDEKAIKFVKIINVAGIDTQKAFTEYTEEKLLRQIKVNAESTLALTHALLTRREEQRELEILTVSSMSGVTPMPYFAVYSATKAMLTNFFTALHYELKKDRVKVTVVMPGGVYTRADIVEEIKSQGFWGKLSAKSPEFVAEKSLKAVRKNKIKYIPGFFNKFLNVLMKIAPKRIVLSFIAKRWKKHSKDAF